MSRDVNSCIHWLRPCNPPPIPPHWDSYTRALLLVSKDRRYLFVVTPCLQVMAAAGGGKDGVEIQTARIVKYPTQRARLHTLRTSTPLDPAARQAAATNNKSAGGPQDAAAPFGDRQSQFQTALMEAADRSVKKRWRI